MGSPENRFPERLKAAREAAGLSRQQLALAVGLTRQVIHLYETGQREPTWSVVQRLADTLHVGLDNLRG